MIGSDRAVVTVVLVFLLLPAMEFYTLKTIFKGSLQYVLASTPLNLTTHYETLIAPRHLVWKLNIQKI